LSRDTGENKLYFYQSSSEVNNPISKIQQVKNKLVIHYKTTQEPIETKEIIYQMLKESEYKISPTMLYKYCEKSRESINSTYMTMTLVLSTMNENYIVLTDRVKELTVSNYLGENSYHLIERDYLDCEELFRLWDGKIAFDYKCTLSLRVVLLITIYV
jgi:hypothetical protein